MVPMPIVRPTLKDDITKLEADFFNGYRDGDRVYYLSATDSKGNFQFVDDEVRASWSPNWTQANAVFESKSYIDRVHTEDYEHHVFVDSIILAPDPDDIPSLSTAMHDINK
jgi:hypothetical protein